MKRFPIPCTCEDFIESIESVLQNESVAITAPWKEDFRSCWESLVPRGTVQRFDRFFSNLISNVVMRPRLQALYADLLYNKQIQKRVLVCLMRKKLKEE